MAEVKITNRTIYSEAVEALIPAEELEELKRRLLELEQEKKEGSQNEII